MPDTYMNNWSFIEYTEYRKSEVTWVFFSDFVRSDRLLEIFEIPKSYNNKHQHHKNKYMFHSICQRAEKLENGKDYGHKNDTDYCQINICIYLKSFLIVKKPLLSNLFISISGVVIGH